MPLAAASAAAVLRRLEALLLVHFHRRSIRLVRAWQSGRMHIDYRSVAELELLRSKRDGKTDGTLLAVLDRTCTRIGKRALLADVLSPPCSTVSRTTATGSPEPCMLECSSSTFPPPPAHRPRLGCAPRD